MSTYLVVTLIILAISILLNVFLAWYAIAASRKLTIVASNLEEIVNSLGSFQNHLEAIYKMETFYGDETLQSALNHSKGLTEFLSGFEDIYELSEELLDETEEEQEEVDVGQESNKFTSQAQEEEEKTPKKVVFHSGT